MKLVEINECFNSVPIFGYFCCFFFPRESIPARGREGLTVNTCGPGPGGSGDLAPPAGAAGRLPSDGAPGDAAVSVEHHYLAGSHRQLACRNTAAKNRVAGISITRP